MDKEACSLYASIDAISLDTTLIGLLVFEYHPRWKVNTFIAWLGIDSTTTTSWSSIGVGGDGDGGGSSSQGKRYQWRWNGRMVVVRRHFGSNCGSERVHVAFPLLPFNLVFFLPSLILRSARNHSLAHLFYFLGSKNYTTLTQWNIGEWHWATRVCVCPHAWHHGHQIESKEKLTLSYFYCRV